MRYNKFHMVEAGARWGTWGFRAMAAAKTIFGNNFNTQVLFYEPNKLHCDGLKETAEVNFNDRFSHNLFHVNKKNLGFAKLKTRHPDAALPVEESTL